VQADGVADGGPVEQPRSRGSQQAMMFLASREIVTPTILRLAAAEECRRPIQKEEDASLLSHDQKLLTKKAPGRAAGKIAPN
jgi:hypothetical protein